MDQKIVVTSKGPVPERFGPKLKQHRNNLHATTNNQQLTEVHKEDLSALVDLSEFASGGSK